MLLFLFATSSRPAQRPTQPPAQRVLRVPSPGVKRLWREFDHSPQFSAEVKNACSYTSTPPIHLNGVVVNKVMNMSA
jgi:hypothetical protein